MKINNIEITIKNDDGPETTKKLLKRLKSFMARCKKMDIEMKFKSEEIKIGDEVFVVSPTKKTASFPEGVFKGECVSINTEGNCEKYRIEYAAPWGGTTSGWYNDWELGHSEQDWVLKQ